MEFGDIAWKYKCKLSQILLFQQDSVPLSQCVTDLLLSISMFNVQPQYIIRNVMFIKTIVHSEMRLEKQLSKLSKVMTVVLNLLFVILYSDLQGHCTKLQIKDLKLLSQSMNLTLKNQLLLPNKITLYI